MPSHSALRHSLWGLVIGLIAFPASSYGWNDTGHEIIASITYDELTPAVQTAAIDLLKQHPRYEKDLLQGVPEGFDAQRYAFMMAATWPDLVKGQTHPMHFVANHPAWHYVDIPVVQPGYALPSTKPAPTTESGEPGNILEALDKVSGEVQNPALAAGDRAIALCWVIHLCGDLHQPLHASNFYSPQYPDGDHGGNLQMILRMPNQFYSRINLHALWDQMLGTYSSMQMIGYVAAGLHGDPRFAREKFAAELAVHDFTTWARESHDLAVSQIYLNGTLQTADENLTRTDHSIRIPSLPAGYLADGEALTARQAMLAAYRTADLLNRLLSPASQLTK
jgi:hypothetical protein